MKRSTSGGFDSPYEKMRYDLDVNAGSRPAQSTWKYLKKTSKRVPPSNASIGGYTPSPNEVWCNGSTIDFGSVSGGSSPSTLTNLFFYYGNNNISNDFQSI